MKPNLSNNQGKRHACRSYGCFAIIVGCHHDVCCVLGGSLVVMIVLTLHRLAWSMQIIHAILFLPNGYQESPHYMTFPRPPYQHAEACVDALHCVACLSSSTIATYYMRESSSNDFRIKFNVNIISISNVISKAWISL